MKRIYLDHAATTPTDAECAELMFSYSMKNFGNPSSLHFFGRQARSCVQNARQQVARLLHAERDEIIFTSGGSESDNFALKGAALANREKGRHIITTQMEHHAVLHTCKWLEQEGFSVTYLPVNKNGRVLEEDIRRAIRPDTTLISMMFANNELGTIQPVAAVGEMARSQGILFHTDAVQAAGHIPVDVKKMQIDLLSLSGHKFYGPSGMGALFVRRGAGLENLLHGGGQEFGLRAGTENVPGICGLGLAAEKAARVMAEEEVLLRGLCRRLQEGIAEIMPSARFNGIEEKRLPGHLHVSFPGIDGQALLLALDMKGIAVSAGSACTAGKTEISHVLSAIGLTEEVAAGSIRFSLGRENSKEEVDAVLALLPKLLARLLPE